MGEAPDDVGEMVVKIVVTSCEELALAGDAEDEVCEAADCVVVDDCA